jgi:hypothetical protein
MKVWLGPLLISRLPLHGGASQAAGPNLGFVFDFFYIIEVQL